MSDELGIINLFLRPPIGLTKLELIPGGPYTGAGDFTRPRTVVPIGNVGVDAFGIRYLVSTFPPGYGITQNHVSLSFDRVVLELGVQHRLNDGAEVLTDEVAYKGATGVLRFSESFPLRVRFNLAPGVSANFWWLVRLLASANQQLQ